MLLHQIHDRVTNKIEDTTYWTEARITTLANNCLDDIVANNPVLGAEAYTTFSTVDGTQRYSTPVDYVDTEKLWYNSGYNQTITILNSPNDIYGKVTDPDTEGPPTHAFLWATADQPEFWFYPVPDDSYTMYHFYYALHADLVNDYDEPQIPRALHKYICDYCIWSAKVEDEIMTELEFKGLWEIVLKQISGFETKQSLHGNSVRPGNAQGMFPGNIEKNIPQVKLAGTYRW